MSLFGVRLRTLREARGWDRVQLSVRANVPVMTIWRLEHGKHAAPRMDVAVRLAQAFGTSLDWMVGRYDEAPLVTVAEEEQL